jgi:hypothetical protein
MNYREHMEKVAISKRRTAALLKEVSWESPAGDYLNALKDSKKPLRRATFATPQADMPIPAHPRDALPRITAGADKASVDAGNKAGSFSAWLRSRGEGTAEQSWRIAAK